MFKMDAGIPTQVHRQTYCPRGMLVEFHISVPIVVAFGFFTPYLEYLGYGGIGI